MLNARSKQVVVVPFDPEWPMTFEALRTVYASVLSGHVAAIEHVGSTAVTGLAAKPIIDIDVVIRSRDALAEVVSRLAAVGYRHQGDLGVSGREAFSRNGAEDVPREGTARRWPDHNLYACAADCPELRRHLLFRDWLRGHPGRAAEYGALKQHLAQVHREDRDAYTLGKTEFIEAVLAEAGASDPFTA
jgi:GrpB-like predicted nucleotidyltransferase (UPF0157 family)